jgi:hypothetical protein
MARLPFLGLGPPFKLSDRPLLSLDSQILRDSSLQVLPHATIGNDCETREAITIGDTERRGGLYILGKSGMGKSWLIVKLILDDIKHGHGLLFLDAHGKGIDELIQCCDSERVKESVLLFDPTKKDRAFGINLLTCRDTSDIGERHLTYTRVKGVFDKLWKTAYYEMPWLQKIIQYTVYAFIENQEYTLVDIPLFLKDTSFRNMLVGNIKYNHQAVKFWKYEFSPKEAEATITRVETLLGDPYVSHIVSQARSTIDFTEFINGKRIVLFRLPDTLSTEVKTFIGTIIISELVHNVRLRSTHNPPQFLSLLTSFSSSAVMRILRSCLQRPVNTAWQQLLRTRSALASLQITKPSRAQQTPR